MPNGDKTNPEGASDAAQDIGGETEADVSGSADLSTEESERLRQLGAYLIGEDGEHLAEGLGILPYVDEDPGLGDGVDLSVGSQLRPNQDAPAVRIAVSNERRAKAAALSNVGGETHGDSSVDAPPTEQADVPSERLNENLKVTFDDLIGNINTNIDDPDGEKVVVFLKEQAGLNSREIIQFLEYARSNRLLSDVILDSDEVKELTEAAQKEIDDKAEAKRARDAKRMTPVVTAVVEPAAEAAATGEPAATTGEANSRFRN